MASSSWMRFADTKIGDRSLLWSSPPWTSPPTTAAVSMAMWNRSSTRGCTVANGCCARSVTWWPPASAPGAQMLRGTPMAKILLVEDDEMNRDMLSRRLERRGYHVVMAVDGGQGLRLAQSEAPDLILMDMSLPVLDGWEATRQLKAAPATQAIPILALTAHAMAGDREKAVEAGCDDYDTKPIEFPRLLAKIQALLAQEGTS